MGTDVAGSRRRPLSDTTNRNNIISTPPRTAKSHFAINNSSSPGLPHHESLTSNGGRTLQSATAVPENKRVSTVNSEDHNDSKRSSQISTTSTNASITGRKRKTHIGPWQLGGDIGQGGCGKVRKVRHSHTHQQAAVKIIPKAVAENARAESLANLVESSKGPHAGSIATRGHVMPFGIEREVVIMKLLEHKNVVRLYDVWENRNELYLIMEYVEGGELFDYIEKAEDGCLGEDETVYLFRQMVAALLHCHRLGIHHRDLKPENILLDLENLTVKLVDFGMAALQPRGKNLTTACGSYHYAAPEIFEKKYDGSMVDVWSLGVILYVMLTGTAPFVFDQATMANNATLFYNIIKRGDFYMPPDLSKEAQDLIWRMLVPEPKKRITLENVWNHPFIHKYEAAWEEPEGSGRIENWIGPRPIIANWKLHDRADIDREILRSLRTLWHSEKEEVLISRLLNPKKYFYSALQRHRDEQLESYIGPPDGVSYSASDYHYIKKSAVQSATPPPPERRNTRTKSQFSILNDEHLQSKGGAYSPPPSEKSYDPYRASRDRMMERTGDYTNITVHRRDTKHSNSTRSDVASIKQATSLRIEALKKEQGRVSVISIANRPNSTSFQPLSATARRSTSKSSLPLRHSVQAARRSMSRSSMGSSLFPSSPPLKRAVKANTTHKRGVDFSRSRRTSAASNLTSPSTQDSLLITPPKPRGLHGQIRDSTSPLGLALTMPDTHAAAPLIRSRKEGREEPTPRPNTRHRQKTHSQVIDSEARKVSTELEKFCEELFFRNSSSPSERTSAAISHETYNTPPSSVSHRTSGRSNLEPITPKPSEEQEYYSKLPLPDVPQETPNTFITREIAETRKRVAARYAQDKGAQTAAYNDVLAHLDALLQPSSRTSSAPEPRSNDFLTSLPIITEETSTTAQQPLQSARQEQKLRKRASADQIWESPKKTNSSTIRLVDQSSPPRIAPLNIRKVNTISSRDHIAYDDRIGSRYYNNTNRSLPQIVRKLSPTSDIYLDPITEESASNGQVSSGRASQLSVSKVPIRAPKKGWFWRKQTGANNTNVKKEASLGDGSSHNYGPPMAAIDPHALKRRSDGGRSQGSGDSVASPVFPNKRPGFMSLFKKRRLPSKQASNLNFSNEDILRSASSDVALSLTDEPESRARKQQLVNGLDFHNERDLGLERNWLSRFLHIRPATRVLCFQSSRGRTRQELVRLLRSWRSYGMRDVVLDRDRNLIFASLDAANHLGIKEVSIVVELFVVLDEGQRAGLSIARFTQRKGAASSFKRVCDTVEEVLGGRRLLVEDREKRKEMEAILSA